MEIEGRSYLVLLLDEAVHRTFTQVVYAICGIDAASHALNFDEFEKAREDGYKVLLVLSSPDLRSFANELDAHSGAIASPCDPSKITFDEGIIISD